MCFRLSSMVLWLWLSSFVQAVCGCRQSSFVEAVNACGLIYHAGCQWLWPHLSSRLSVAVHHLSCMLSSFEHGSMAVAVIYRPGCLWLWPHLSSRLSVAVHHLSCRLSSFVQAVCGCGRHLSCRQSSFVEAVVFRGGCQWLWPHLSSRLSMAVASSIL